MNVLLNRKTGERKYVYNVLLSIFVQDKDGQECCINNRAVSLQCEIRIRHRYNKFRIFMVTAYCVTVS